MTAYTLTARREDGTEYQIGHAYATLKAARTWAKRYGAMAGVGPVRIMQGGPGGIEVR